MGFLDNIGLTHLWGKIQTALAEKLDTSGGTLTGELKIAGAGISRVFDASGDKSPSISVFARKDLTKVKSNIHFIGPGDLEYNSENVPVQIVGVDDPTEEYHAANKNYVDTAVSGKMDEKENFHVDESGMSALNSDGTSGILMYNSGAIRIFSGDCWMELDGGITPEIGTSIGTLATKDYVNTAMEELVSGQGVSTIRTLTQAQYDALTTKGTTTLYLIKEGA